MRLQRQLPTQAVLPGQAAQRPPGGFFQRHYDLSYPLCKFSLKDVWKFGMLCHLAHSFPPKVAELLERDRGLKRNFREETVTDLLMASLIGLQSFGIRVDFPYEPTTGGDMDWMFAAPREIGGGKYLRLILQAKRAQFQQTKSGGYWYYQHLDHQKGLQAQTLVSHAGSSPGGVSTLPLYIFYHPRSALSAATATLPPVEGINLVFAHQIAPVVKGGCGKKEKKLGAWRTSFMPLSDILCWPASFMRPSGPAGPRVFAPMQIGMPPIAAGFHPDIVAARLERRLERNRGKVAKADIHSMYIRAADAIPDEVRRAIDGTVTDAERKQLQRPRVIFSTPVTSADREFKLAVALAGQ